MVATKQQKKAPKHGSSVQPDEQLHTIVFYSPDMDFCLSLQLLFQDRYNVVTTTDADMLLMMVRTFEPNLVIVDGIPTERMRNRIEKMKSEFPHLHVMFFYVHRIGDKRYREAMWKSVDAAFSKPVDLAEVTERIQSLVEAES
jgi:DNA-binding NarL/FixJ family response regulator